MPGVLRFGKRSYIDGLRDRTMEKKEMPGVLRFGKRALENEKKSVPGESSIQFNESLPSNSRCPSFRKTRPNARSPALRQA